MSESKLAVAGIAQMMSSVWGTSPANGIPIVETETITVQLKSCPFCGGVAAVRQGTPSWASECCTDEVWHIECTGCPARMESEGEASSDLESVVAAWNHEPPARAER